MKVTSTTAHPLSRLSTTIQALEKRYGKGIVMQLGSQQAAKVPVISTGSIQLDHALGTGGFPCGRVVEIYGPEASGKTTLALHVVAEAQKKGGKALLIDSEHAFDREYAMHLGIRVDELFICQPDYGEQALDVAEQCIRSQSLALVVVDSVSALVPETELKGEMGGTNIGGQARLMSQAMRKLTAILHKAGVLCIFINQIRHKIGITYGSPEVTSGGHALKFYASVRVEIRAIKAIKDTLQQKIGHRARVKITKNKLAVPFKEVELDILYGQGISRSAEVIKLAIVQGVIQQKGNWFSHQNQQIGQGKEAVAEWLEKDPERYARIYRQLHSTVLSDQ